MMRILSTPNAQRPTPKGARLLAVALLFGIVGGWELGVRSSPAAAQGRGAAANARANAAVDLTGTWVSLVTEDWRWRMRTPPKGDYASLPLTPAATKMADAWDPARDTAAGEQ